MWRHYLLTACKVFMRRKLFTLINLTCIILTLVVLLVTTALLEHMFYPNGVEGKNDRILQVFRLSSVAPDGRSINYSQLGFKLIEKYLKPMTSVEKVAVISMPHMVSVYQDDTVSDLLMRNADAAYWQVLDFKLLAGRLPTVADEQPDQAVAVAVLNASSAQRLFPGPASARRAIGRPISVGGQPFVVIGVVEDVLHFNAFGDIWAPITTMPSNQYRSQMAGNFIAILLARDAGDLPHIRREVEQIAARVQFDPPDQARRAHFWADSKLDLLARVFVGQQESADPHSAALVVSIAVLMLLFMLLPALNLVNLNMGRIIERREEIGVRRAFGATSAQLVLQLMFENLLLCLAGGVLSFACAAGVLAWLGASGLIPYLRVSLNTAVFGYGLLITIVFGLLSGAIPAWRMARLDPVQALRGGR